MRDIVPEVTSIEEIYPQAGKDAQQQRWDHLLSKFRETYGSPAEFVSRSPGRVNIIGEHIDYMLFPVIPMAIGADFLLAVRAIPNTSTIKIANVLDSKFPRREFEVPVEGSLEIDPGEHEWSNYFKSGLRGALELLLKKGVKPKQAGMEILADGVIPVGAGLSSSAAFTCASALASLVVLGDGKVDRRELVDLAVVSERYVGVNSGGMDQSASVLAAQGHALYISFHPTLDVQPLSLPKTSPEPTFVIVDSLVPAEKHKNGPINYNLRVVECTLAARVLANKLNLGALPEDEGPLGNSLKGLMDTYFANKGEISLEQKLEELAEVVEKGLDKEKGYTKEEVADILGLPVGELVQQCMVKFPIISGEFPLGKRALHVVQEALRVAKFKSLLDETVFTSSDSSDVLLELGKIMNESHESCRDLYNCSCPELDQICDLARSAGSYGSRLTGAGWGGCSVHLVPQDKVEAVKKAWKEGYYKKNFPGISEEEVERAILVSKPGTGAMVFKVQQ